MSYFWREKRLNEALKEPRAFSIHSTAILTDFAGTKHEGLGQENEGRVAPP